MTEAQAKEMELQFWKDCYTATLAGGKNPRGAKGTADQAVLDLRDHLEVLALNNGRIGAVA